MTPDIILNLAIFGITFFLIGRFFRRDGKWRTEETKKAFRFFTCQSNALCAVSALVMAVARLAGGMPLWVWLLKYIGTAAVTVTMVTVFVFLAPSIGKGWFDILLKSPRDMFMHLLTPLMALFSFCVLEKQGMTFPQSLLGMLPVVLYGPWYLYKIIYAPPEKRWEDFYGFNRGGKWPVAFTGMVIGTFLICMGIMALQNVGC